MGSSAVDLDKHSLALLAAKSDVVSGRAAASWALFGYEKSNELKLLDSGGGGPDELAKRFQNGRIMYGLCRLSESAAGMPHIVLIRWVGEKVLDSQQEACAGHLPAIRAFFKGTNYQKTNPLLEILHTRRSSFWVQAEREEEQRRALEEQRRWEHQRMEEECREAAERERRVQEKEQLVQEQRKQQAQREAEEHCWEEARRREQAKAISRTSPWSQAGKSALQDPAAGPGSQQPHHPWDSFQQRDRPGWASGDPGPGMPRRCFLRYQRSLTESAYIFRLPDPDLSGSFQASPPAIGPKPGTPTSDPEGRLPSTGSLPQPALPSTSSLLALAHCETEAAPPRSTPCPAPPALACALNGAEAEPASPPLPPGPSPSPKNEFEPPRGQGCSPLAAPCGEALSPSPATSGRAAGWAELPGDSGGRPRANPPPSALPGGTVPTKGKPASLRLARGAGWASEGR
ncbi:drebrin-like [Candoia aspera]|uniref:drebrin-like n=1 Tax=Candoia aspera TaxID=51853 RepID=UPI002FD80D62